MTFLYILLYDYHDRFTTFWSRMPTSSTTSPLEWVFVYPVNVPSKKWMESSMNVSNGTVSYKSKLSFFRSLQEMLCRESCCRTTCCHHVLCHDALTSLWFVWSGINITSLLTYMCLFHSSITFTLLCLILPDNLQGLSWLKCDVFLHNFFIIFLSKQSPRSTSCREERLDVKSDGNRVTSINIKSLACEYDILTSYCSKPADRENDTKTSQILDISDDDHSERWWKKIESQKNSEFVKCISFSEARMLFTESSLINLGFSLKRLTREARKESFINNFRRDLLRFLSLFISSIPVNTW